MTDNQLRRAAIRTLRAGFVRRNPPGERREHLLARLDLLLEQTSRVAPPSHPTQVASGPLTGIDPFLPLATGSFAAAKRNSSSTRYLRLDCPAVNCVRSSGDSIQPPPRASKR
jgi:hypothetical protein